MSEPAGARDAALGARLGEGREPAHVVTLAGHDGERTAVVEAADFWSGARLTAVTDAVRDLDPNTAVTLVPPGFLPANLDTPAAAERVGRDLATCADWRARTVLEPTPLAAALEKGFADVPPTAPLGEYLDSLRRVELGLVLKQHGLTFDPAARLCDLLGLRADARTAPTGPILRVVSLQDGITLPPLPAFLASLSERLGMPVHFEHLCVPPGPILWSDVVFHDWFLPRAPDLSAPALVDCVRKLRSADLILVDDVTEYALPESRFIPMVYPRLAHDLVDDPESAFLALRLQRYAAQHDRLPTKLVPGRDLTSAARDAGLVALETGLGIPVLKIALCPEYREHTANWDHGRAGTTGRFDYRTDCLGADELVEAIAAFVARRAVAPSEGILTDIGIPMHQPHFCSWLVRREAVDFVVEGYQRICALGQAASVPYLTTRARARGRTLFFHARPEALPRREHDCIVLAGAWGMPVSQKPTFPLVFASIGASWKPANLTPEASAGYPFPVWDPAKGPQSRA